MLDKRQRLVLQAGGAAEDWIVGRYVGTDAERGLHQSGRSSARTARTACGAAGPRAGSACSVTADAAADRALDDTGIDAAKEAAGLGALDVSVGDGQVVARDRQIEIVLQRQINSVLQRDVEFAVANELLQPRRIRKIRFRNQAGR